MCNDRIIRENMSMTQFTCYIDDLTKLEVLKKLKELGLDTKKGSLSATIRVMLREFADADTMTMRLSGICDKIKEEYLLTTKKNKRSTM